MDWRGQINPEVKFQPQASGEVRKAPLFRSACGADEECLGRRLETPAAHTRNACGAYEKWPRHRREAPAAQNCRGAFHAPDFGLPGPTSNSSTTCVKRGGAEIAEKAARATLRSLRLCVPIIRANQFGSRSDLAVAKLSVSQPLKRSAVKPVIRQMQIAGYDDWQRQRHETHRHYLGRVTKDGEAVQVRDRLSPRRRPTRRRG